MSSDSDAEQTTDDIAEPVVSARRSFSKAWLVPVVAAGIAGWMIVTSYLERGPQIRITFQNAEGLVAGKTVVKYKNINVGEVEGVSLSDDLGQVIVTARLDRIMASHLGEGSRFWVVKPRIGPSGVSGLDTLLSGAYIEFDPVDGQREKSFVGLEQPPTTPSDAAGRHLILKARTLGSVNVGAQILYRDIRVGQVESYRLRDDYVEIDVYIEEAYANLVRTGTRFWQTSGIELAMSADGFRFSTASLDSLLSGGLAFETPAGTAGGGPVENGASFQLYSHYDEIGEEYVGNSFEVIMYFENSVRGLSIGAPIEFRGIKIGQVTEVSLQYHLEKTWLQIPVRARVEPERLRVVGDPSQPFLETLDMMVKRGLRARVATGNLLTGAMFIDLDFEGGAPLEIRGSPGDPYEIPTLPSGTDELLDNATDLLAKLEKMPIEGLLKEGQETLATARRAVTELDGEIEALVGKLNATVENANRVLTNLETAIPDGARLESDLGRVLKEVSGAAASVKKLADLLAREPESIIRGRR